MAGRVHLLKLCVGATSLDDLILWQQRYSNYWPKGCAVHTTKMWPKREQELLNGGSLYWVIKGMILCHQRVLRLEPVKGDDNQRRCAIILDAAIERTVPTPRRAFQGWRYLDHQSAPPDLHCDKNTKYEDALPDHLAQALSEMGLR